MLVLCIYIKSQRCGQVVRVNLGGGGSPTTFLTRNTCLDLTAWSIQELDHCVLNFCTVLHPPNWPLRVWVFLCIGFSTWCKRCLNQYHIKGPLKWKLSSYFIGLNVRGTNGYFARVYGNNRIALLILIICSRQKANLGSADRDVTHRMEVLSPGIYKTLSTNINNTNGYPTLASAGNGEFCLSSSIYICTHMR